SPTSETDEGDPPHKCCASLFTSTGSQRSDQYRSIGSATSLGTLCFGASIGTSRAFRALFST
ncbi:MAG: hypothetical protein ACI4UW_05530, partial [Muribaculaceae bacterium]